MDNEYQSNLAGILKNSSRAHRQCRQNVVVVPIQHRLCQASLANLYTSDSDLVQVDEAIQARSLQSFIQ